MVLDNKEGETLVLNLLKSHASVRKYTDEEITDEQFHELLVAAQHAASSNFIQAYSVIQVKDEAKRKRLGELSKNEKQFNSAALSLVFCADLNRLEQATNLHNKSTEAGSLENFIVATVDVSLFAQNFVVAAESKGYGICYIGGVRNNPEAISELLEIPHRVIPLFGMTVGVPAEQNEVKPRLPIENILHIDSYDKTKYLSLLNEYDEIMKKYYNSRTMNKKDITWTETMASFMSTKRRLFMKDFVLSKGLLIDELNREDEGNN